MSVLIGFESLSAANLRQMGKSWNQTADGSSGYAGVVKKFHQRGVAVYGTFVFGYDGDTVEIIQKTLNFALEAGLGVERVARLYRDPRNDRVLLRDLDLMRRGLGPLVLVTVDGGEFERGLPLEPRCAPQALGRSQATCLAEHGSYRVWRIQP